MNTLLSLTALAMAPRPALADGACAGLAVDVDPAIEPAYRAEIERFCREAPLVRDLESGARVEIVPGEPVVVRVTLADGRSAQRHVGHPAALRHTLEGLLTRPPEAAPLEGPPEASPAAPPVLPAAPPARPAEGSAAAPRPRTNDRAGAPRPRPAEQAPISGAPAPSPEPDSAPSVEVGALLEGRVLGAPAYGAIGVQAWVDLDVDDWLVGLDVRWDPYMMTDTRQGFHMSSIGGGAFAGRRFRPVERLALDVAVGVQIVDEIQSIPIEEEGEPLEEGGAGDRDEAAGQSVDVRPDLSLMAHWGGEGTRFSSGLGFELSPARLASSEQLAPELPTLPTWAASLGIGVSWGRP